MGLIHETLVRELVERHGADRIGFSRKLTAALHQQLGDCGLGEHCRMIPDAFRIDGAARSVRVWEVEVTHPVGDRLARQYALLWDALDFYDWELEVLTVDRQGREAELDLRGIFWTHTVDLARRTPAP